jgi:hypothetical protein
VGPQNSAPDIAQTPAPNSQAATRRPPRLRRPSPRGAGVEALARPHHLVSLRRPWRSLLPSPSQICQKLACSIVFTVVTSRSRSLSILTAGLGFQSGKELADAAIEVIHRAKLEEQALSIVSLR